MSEEAEVATEQSEMVTEGTNPLFRPDPEPQSFEWLPEKFKTPEDLVNSYNSLESKIGQKEEDFRNQFMKEMEEQAYANRPETVGDYELPEGLDEQLADNNELLQWWAKTAFENGYSQDEFAEGINMYMSAINADVPDYETELSKLGDNASARTEAVSLFANQFFPEEHLSAIERMCETAEGVMALEHIMDNMRQSGPSDGGNRAEQINENDLKQMMLDPRYHDPARRDPSFVAQIEQGFKRLYG